MAEGGQRPEAVRAIEVRRGSRIVLGHLRQDIHARLGPSHGVAATVNMYFEENLCHKITHEIKVPNFVPSCMG